MFCKVFEGFCARLQRLIYRIPSVGILVLPDHIPEYRIYCGLGSEMRPPFMHTTLVLAVINTFQRYEQVRGA